MTTYDENDKNQLQIEEKVSVSGKLPQLKIYKRPKDDIDDDSTDDAQAWPQPQQEPVINKVLSKKEETKMVKLKRLFDTAEIQLPFYLANRDKFTKLISFCMYSILKDPYLFSDDELWDTYLNEFNDGKSEDSKKLALVLRYVLVEPESKMGKKFEEWCKKDWNNADFDKIKTEYKQMIAKDNYTEKKNDNVKKSKIKAVKYSELMTLGRLMSLGLRREKELSAATVHGVEVFAKYVVVEDLYDFENDELFQNGASLYLLSGRKTEAQKKQAHIELLSFLQPTPVEILQRYQDWMKNISSTKINEIVRAYEKIEMAEDISNDVVDEEAEQKYSSSNKHATIAKNDTSNKRIVYPALYCTRGPCGFGHHAKDCGKCGKNMIKVKSKAKAYLCTGCGFGHKGKKCIKCGKPVMGRSVQAYLCTGCGFGHKGKKCVKCGAHVWGI